MNTITDEQIIATCREQSLATCNLAVEDFVKTDIGFIEVIVPVYEQLTGKTYDEESADFDTELDKRIFDCLMKIDTETLDPDYDNPDSDFNKRCAEAGI